MGLEKIRMRFTFRTENSKPIIKSWPINTQPKGFFIDLEGDEISDIVEEVLSYAYEQKRYFSEGYAPVQLLGKWGLVDIGLNEVIEPQYDDIDFVNEGFVFVKSGHKYGYLNMHDSTNNHKCTDFKFDKAYDFCNGMAMVIIGGKYGFISSTNPNEMAIPCIFDDAYNFGHLHPYAIVKYKGKYGMIDKKGNYVIEPKFDSYSDYTSNIPNTKIAYNAKIGERFYLIKADGTVTEF